MNEEHWRTVNRKPDIEQKADSDIASGAGCLLMAVAFAVVLLACAFAARIVGS